MVRCLCGAVQVPAVLLPRPKPLPSPPDLVSDLEAPAPAAPPTPIAWGPVATAALYSLALVLYVCARVLGVHR